MKDLTLLEPGCDENPLDHQPVEYNPFNFAYPMIIETESGPIEIMVRFLVDQTGPPKAPIVFNHGGTDYSLPLFPELPEHGLQPIQIPGVIGMEGYQMGENHYWITPAIVRARRINGAAADYIPGGGETGQDLLTETAVRYLITPEMLLDRLRQYRVEVSQDPNAPVPLLEILDHFDEEEYAMLKSAAHMSEDDDLEELDEEDEEDDLDDLDDEDDEDLDDWEDEDLEEDEEDEDLEDDED